MTFTNLHYKGQDSPCLETHATLLFYRSSTPTETWVTCTKLQINLQTLLVSQTSLKNLRRSFGAFCSSWKLCWSPLEICWRLLYFFVVENCVPGDITSLSTWPSRIRLWERWLYQHFWSLLANHLMCGIKYLQFPGKLAWFWTCSRDLPPSRSSLWSLWSDSTQLCDRLVTAR